MVQHLIVPVDDSPESWVAFDVAHALAARCDADIRIVHVIFEPADRRPAEDGLHDEISRRGPFEVEVTFEVRLAYESVSHELDQVVELHPGAVIVMASHGKGRSAAIVGSVAENVLQRSFGPLMLVGPHVEPDDFSGPVVATVDGSDDAELALPLAVAWATELRSTPWIVNVSAPTTSHSPMRSDTFETAYPARLAKELTSFSGRPVEFDELHGKHPATAVTDYATRNDASLIVASSHGRTGLSRLAMGSVVSGFVRHATCPVLVVRPPHPQHVEVPAAATPAQA